MKIYKGNLPHFLWRTGQYIPDWKRTVRIFLVEFFQIQGQQTFNDLETFLKFHEKAGSNLRMVRAALVHNTAGRRDCRLSQLSV